MSVNCPCSPSSDATLDRDPQQFDSRWLTAEGLAQSKGEFEDFVEPGTWSVFLARDPDTYAKTYAPTLPADRSVDLSMTKSQQNELFKELGAEWNRQTTSPGESPVIPAFPLLSLRPLRDELCFVAREPGQR